jgi:hypothetical protein
MGSSRATAAALIASLVLAPIAALAQPKPNDAQMTQAKDLVNKAITKSQAGDHAAAIELYLQAYNIAPLPLLLSNLGSEYQQAQKPIEALKYFCKYLEVEPTGPNAGYATSQAKVLQTQLHNSVDDNNVCKALPPPQPTAGSGAGSVDSSPPPTPVQQPVPPPVAPVEAADPGHGMKLAGMGVAGVGVVLAVVGIVYGSKASSISSDITNHPKNQPWPDDIQAQESEGQSDQNKQIGFLIAGGAAIGVGVALYVVGRGKRSSEDHPPMAVVPTAAPGFAGLTWVGGF